jgi:hypothetical protein
MSLDDFQGVTWAHRRLMRMAADDQHKSRQGAGPIRTWRIRFWAWLSRVSHRRLMTLAIRDQRVAGTKLARFPHRRAGEPRERMARWR